MIIDKYEIHDNGERPFIVKVYPNNLVQIYQNDYDLVQVDEYFYEQVVQKVFIGESPQLSGGHSDNFLGNSILLHVKDLEYVFIGESVFSFQAQSEIVKYVSPMGPNDVPYPYAIDIDNGAYLTVENVIVQLTDEEVSDIPCFDPYDYYYPKHILTTDLGRIPPRQPMIANFEDIKEYYIGEKQYTMDYNPFPEKDYDRIIGWGEGGMSVLLTDGTKKKLNKEEYTNIINDFGYLAGFQPLESKTIHNRRW